IQNRNPKQAVRVCVGPEERDCEAVAKIDEPQKDRADQISHAGQTENCRQNTDRNQRATEKNNLTAGSFTADVDGEAGASVVFREDPCDGKEMRHLPQKKNSE